MLLIASTVQHFDLTQTSGPKFNVASTNTNISSLHRLVFGYAWFRWKSPASISWTPRQAHMRFLVTISTNTSLTLPPARLQRVYQAPLRWYLVWISWKQILEADLLFGDDFVGKSRSPGGSQSSFWKFCVNSKMTVLWRQRFVLIADNAFGLNYLPWRRLVDRIPTGMDARLHQNKLIKIR